MHKILIVEDDVALSRGLVDNFKAEGFDVVSTDSGSIGLELALDDGPSIALLDIMLPEVNGLEICQAIRAEGLEYPVVMLTAKGQESDIVRGLEMGADDYLTKPFSIRELIARVRVLMRRHGSRGEGLISFGECEIDLASQVLRKGGEEVKLTQKEYKLLEFFLRREGKALTRKSIMNQVWGSSILVTQRSVDRCVTTLRAKIEEEPSKPVHIKTIRDVGYRFEKE
ncbi:response regulator transcription factor [Puniceicoccaceae bacterium K14]|nr:response regulator transcription factor [Puniceicoccaceae bacterium K14]